MKCHTLFVFFRIGRKSLLQIIGGALRVKSQQSRLSVKLDKLNIQLVVQYSIIPWAYHDCSRRQICDTFLVILMDDKHCYFM